MRLFPLVSTLALALSSSIPAPGQVNQWMKDSSGQWHENHWSLGVLPAVGQAVVINNEGSKTVSIDAETARDHPQSLSIESLELGSPAGSQNALLIDQSSTATPLTLKSGLIGTNTLLTLRNAGLVLTGLSGSGLSIGGTVVQGDGSLVSGQQLDLGYIGPGVYSLLGGEVRLAHAWVGGPFSGTFNQTGGSNGIGIVHLETGGTYNLSGGVYAAADTYFNNNSVLRQTGGRITTGMRVWRGTYLLEDGVNAGGMMVPVGDGWSSSSGNAVAIQSGGTNSGIIELGYWGNGTYTVSNGLCSPSFLDVGPMGELVQRSGRVEVAGTARLGWGWVDRNLDGWGRFEKTAGLFSCEELDMQGHFIQSGGSSRIAGVMRMGSLHAEFHMNDGLLTCRDSVVGASVYGGGFFQTGGVQVISNSLSISGESYAYRSFGFVLGGGEVTVSNVLLHPWGQLSVTNGTLTHLGRFRMNGADLRSSAAVLGLGQLSIHATGSNLTNSNLIFPPGRSARIHFKSSSQEPWAGSARLVVSNWSGSVFGGGNHQLAFGNDSLSLTPQQLSQIIFRSPAGLAPGDYGATLLHSGEVVPNALPPTGRVPPRLGLSSQDGHNLTLTVIGQAGATYVIEASGNPLVWTPLARLTNVTGTTSLAVSNTAPQQFFRALLPP